MSVQQNDDKKIDPFFEKTSFKGRKNSQNCVFGNTKNASKNIYACKKVIKWSKLN